MHQQLKPCAIWCLWPNSPLCFYLPCCLVLPLLLQSSPRVPDPKNVFLFLTGDFWLHIALGCPSPRHTVSSNSVLEAGVGLSHLLCQESNGFPTACSSSPRGSNTSGLSVHLTLNMHVPTHREKDTDIDTHTEIYTQIQRYTRAKFKMIFKKKKQECFCKGDGRLKPYEVRKETDSKGILKGREGLCPKHAAGGGFMSVHRLCSLQRSGIHCFGSEQLVDSGMALSNRNVFQVLWELHKRNR